MIENISDFGNIIDIYNINNKIVYSLNTESSFPHIIYNQTKNLKLRIHYRREYEKTKLANLKMVNYIAVRHREKHV